LPMASIGPKRFVRVEFRLAFRNCPFSSLRLFGGGTPGLVVPGNERLPRAREERISLAGRSRTDHEKPAGSLIMLERASPSEMTV
jgi:hypothetical protein